ncbi:MAG: FAD-dependent oxidoreductase [Anaerolineae bacterium]|nr:FAD-dependent oxidoreductase [Anaerolineae bacterium]
MPQDNTQHTAKHIEFTKAIPVVDHVDVLVVGGGPSGIGAALGAARAGAATALVEHYGFLGGAATAGLVGPFMTSFNGDGTTQLIGGVFDELVRRMEDLGGAVHPRYIRSGSAEAGYYVFGHDHVTPFHPETLKVVADEMMVESGVTLYLHTNFVEPLMEGRWLKGAIVHNKSGLQAITAQVIVDCTGDADVAYLAGAPTLKGREQDNLTQPMTMFFRVGGVDDAVVDEYAAQHPEERGRLFHQYVVAAKERGDFPIMRDKAGIYRTLEKGVWRVNTSRLQRLDGTSARDLVTAELAGRQQVHILMDFFHNYLPGFERAVLIDTAVQIGVRETRRIAGEVTLTADDLASGRHFDDTIALESFPVDLHPAVGDGGGTDTGLAIGCKTAAVYEIPYRCLIPRNVEQLLVAGRAVSGTREAIAAIRIMPPCFAMGQAAGIASAIAVRDETSVRDIDVNKLQRILEKQKAILSI